MHSISLSLDPHEMSLNIDMKIILLVKFFGVTLIFDKNSDFTDKLQCGESVEESYPTPHIHEQMTTSNYGYDTAYNFTHNNMLEPNAMNNIDTVAHMNVHNTQYWAHCAPFIDAQLCHIAPVAQVRLARVIPSMHVHLCVASWLFSLHLSCLLLRPTVLLPALPDVHLRVQREVQVQPPVRLPLGDRGHFWPRDTPHR